MNIYETNDYKSYVQAWVQARPKGGRGEYKRIAAHLRMSTVLVSLIFNGDRDLSCEQAYDLAEYLRLTKTERSYFVLMVQLARSGSENLRRHYREELEKFQSKARDLRHRMPHETEMSETAKARYYSNWHYASARLLTSVPGHASIDAIAERLKLDGETVRAVVDFLLEHGLCKVENGKLAMGAQHIHLPKDSPYIKPRQISWRVKAIEHMDHPTEDELFFTGPASLSRADFGKIQMELNEFIERWTKKISDSPAEDLACLNIDWFRF